MYMILFYFAAFMGGASFVTALTAVSRGDAGMVAFCILSIIVSIGLSFFCYGMRED